MLKLIETLRAKPSDKNIRIIRIVFACILAGVLFGGLSDTHWNFTFLPDILLYGLYIFPLLGLIRGAFDPGIMRKKLWKWTQVGIGAFLFLLSVLLIETDTNSGAIIPPQTVSGEISATTLQDVSSSRGIDTDFWLGFLGFWLSLAGLIASSKNITTKNERYGEKVTKIRV